jgi:lipopolysaccharide transport system ATP-binding protein
MSKTVLKVDQMSKLYRLGEVGTGTISHDLNRWWAKIRGKEDPFAKVGEINDRSKKSNSNYVWALKDIDFEVKEGDVLGIIGRNGAGKSTLLKIISQITSPTKGSIKAKGRIAALLEVGTGMNPELTARENIYLNGAILGMRKFEIDRKFDEIVDFSGCALYVDTPIKRFSSGMRVRLGFAVAAFLEPEILIVDEVLAVGDAEFQKKAIGKMQDVTNNDGRTVLFVSHNMAAVKSLCKTGIVLENGQVAYSGTSDDSVNFYLEHSFKLAQIPLQERTDRKGNKKLVVKEIFIENQDKIKVSEMHSGQEYSIVFEYEALKELIDPKQLTIVIQFKNDNDELMTTIATDELGIVYDSIYESGKIKVHMNKLQFREGRYSMSYMISEKLAFNTPHITMDYLQDAFVIDVIRGDYWNSGILNRPKGFIQEANILIDRNF